MADGEVLYEIRGDDSKLEGDLDSAQKKVEQCTEKSAQEVEKIEKEKNESIKKEQEGVTQHHKKEKGKQENEEKKSAKSFKELAKNISEDFKGQMTKISTNVSNTMDKVRHPIKTVSAFAGDKAKDIKKSFTESFEKTKENAIGAMEKVSHAILHPVETAKTAGKGITEHLSAAFKGIGSIAAKAGGAMAAAVGAGMAAAAGTAATAGAIAVNGAVDMDKAMNQFAASTGLGAESLERYQSVLEGVYANNYGESFEDIANTMALIRKEAGKPVDFWEDDALQGLVESVYALQDISEGALDSENSIRAMSTMMEQFGADGQDALGMIAAGYQNGLDFSGELLDSINEYSVHFSKLGMYADDMFNIFQAGVDSGAFSLDKIGDAVKEFSIRVLDGSDTTVAGFQAIGMNADEMAARFAAGGDSARDAFQETIQALAAMEDPLEQNTAGINLFGTMWEDLGPTAVSALADITDGVYNTTDAMNQIKEVKYDDLGSMFEGLKRNIELLLIPLGEQLIPVFGELLEAIMPLVEEALPPLTDAIGGLIGKLSPVIESLLPVLSNTLSELLPPLMDLIQQILPLLSDVLSTLLPPLLDLVSEILPMLVDIIGAILPVLEMLLPLLLPLVEIFAEIAEEILACIAEALVPLIEAIMPLIELLSEVLIPILEILLTVFEEVFSGILSTVTDVVQNNVISILRNLIDFIKNVFTGNWKGAWENISNIFKNIVEAFVKIFKMPINGIIDLINGFLKGLNKIKFPDWVPGVGGKGFNISLIPRLKKGLKFVPGDFFPAYLDYGERVLTQEENLRFSALGGMEGIEQRLSAGQNFGSEQRIMLQKGSIMVIAQIDGKDAAVAMAPYMDTELGSLADQKGRGL